MDTASLSVEDIKIKKEQERANCYGFDVRHKLFASSWSLNWWFHHVFFQDDSDSDWREKNQPNYEVNDGGNRMILWRLQVQLTFNVMQKRNDKWHTHTASPLCISQESSHLWSIRKLTPKPMWLGILYRWNYVNIPKICPVENRYSLTHCLFLWAT